MQVKEVIIAFFILMEQGKATRQVWTTLPFMVYNLEIEGIDTES